jgi:nucleotide-binding universal stress UspA family protein
MIKKILVATDNSNTGKHAVSYAIDFANDLKAELTAITVIDLPPISERQSIAGESSPTHLIEPLGDYMEQVATVFMDEIEAACNQRGIVFHRCIRTGHPVSTIVEAAKEINADIIILGSHGRGALSSALLGSVTLGVIHRDIHIPVLIIK